jgi:hypothetical protein
MSHDYNIAAEGDVKSTASKHIVVYLVILCVSLFLTIYGLMIMFRFQLDDEKEKKIGEVLSHEYLDQKAVSDAYLSGKQGIFADKASMPIEQAMAQFLSSLRQGR